MRYYLIMANTKLRKMLKNPVTYAIAVPIITAYISASLSWNTLNPIEWYRLSKQREEALYIKDIHERDSLHNNDYINSFWDVNNDKNVNLKDYKLSSWKWDRNNDNVVDGHDVKISKEKPIGIQYKGFNR